VRLATLAILSKATIIGRHGTIKLARVLQDAAVQCQGKKKERRRKEKKQSGKKTAKQREKRGATDGVQLEVRDWIAELCRHG
jgi:hypothetical protein